MARELVEYPMLGADNRLFLGQAREVCMWSKFLDKLEVAGDYIQIAIWTALGVLAGIHGESLAALAIIVLLMQIEIRITAEKKIRDHIALEQELFRRLRAGDEIMSTSACVINRLTQRLEALETISKN